MDEKQCPICQNDVRYQNITKGNSVVGVNLFCINRQCKWEVDKHNNEVDKSQW